MFITLSRLNPQYLLSLSSVDEDTFDLCVSLILYKNPMKVVFLRTESFLAWVHFEATKGIKFNSSFRRIRLSESQNVAFDFNIQTQNSPDSGNWKILWMLQNSVNNSNKKELCVLQTNYKTSEKQKNPLYWAPPSFSLLRCCKDELILCILFCSPPLTSCVHFSGAIEIQSASGFTI